MQLFRYGDGTVPNIAALLYVFAGYPLSIIGLAQHSVIVFVLSLLLLAHTLIIAAYLLHECMHQTLFKHSRHNEWLGLVLAWICGACYSDYRLLKNKHLRHHANRIDSLSIDVQALLKTNPALYKLVALLEWCYIPAIELLTRILSILAPFILPGRKQQRPRLLFILLFRCLFFTALAAWNWKILAGYAVAYLLCLRVLGFMDAFQHQYEVRIDLDEEKNAPAFNREYEESHTWSNLLSDRYHWLNLLVLNFCYHNVHHYRPGEPWYRLPRLHAERYPEIQPNLSLRQQLDDFHRYRLHRLGTVDHQETNIGAAGVSFLAGV